MPLNKETQETNSVAVVNHSTMSLNIGDIRSVSFDLYKTLFI